MVTSHVALARLGTVFVAVLITLISLLNLLSYSLNHDQLLICCSPLIKSTLIGVDVVYLVVRF